MEIDAFVQQVIDDKAPSFSDMLLENASALADFLKTEADRYFRNDPNISLRLADTIIQLGHVVNSTGITALGTMSRGDALRMFHRIEEAWQTLDYAGKLFQEAGDEVGWARTRIGLLAICVEMNEVETGLQDAESARDIFGRYNELEKLVRLETNAGVLLNYLGQYQAAIEKSQALLEFIDAHEEVGRRPVVYYIMGHAHQGLGNLNQALMCYAQSRELMAQNNERVGMAYIDLNVISIAQAQGHHKKALQLLHDSIDVLAQHLSLDGDKEMMHVIEGYLFLNRYKDAKDLAQKVIEEHHDDHEDDDLALTILLLAKAEAALGDYEQALRDLDRAEHIFKSLKTSVWLGLVCLNRAQVALSQGNVPDARQSARDAAEHFDRNGQKISYLMALLLAARADAAGEDTETALLTAQYIQTMAREFQLPHLSYEAHLLQGKLEEQVGKPKRAIRHYQIASGIMERIQRSLILTSRSEFLADKQEAADALVRLNLELGWVEKAFAALEGVKAQVWTSYLSQLDHLRWLRDDPRIQPLIEELNQLREEHYWHYRAAYDQVFREQNRVVMPPAEAVHEASVRERQLRTLTERLYLQSSAGELTATPVASLSEIQARLSEGTALVAYYSDEAYLWAFFLDAEGLEVYRLPERSASVYAMLDKWQTNINRALRTIPGSPNATMLRNYAISIVQQLYDALIRPFAARLATLQRVTIVPYGNLHYLPFQLLHNGEQHLIETLEVTIFPTSSLIVRESPRQPRGALALAYGWDGRLSYTKDDAQLAVDHFGGDLYCEAQATQPRFSASPLQILHISAHGEYRMDQPDFSYIQLADGPVYTDDLFQHDLRYELVTLSACETGRSHAAAGDELIGLGRGFLFAGAGALIASLWRVDEVLTLELMEELYRQLDAGASKAAALREAQLMLLRRHPQLHPAFWGAFELIGNPEPLSHIN